jgi:cytidylate kinase
MARQDSAEMSGFAHLVERQILLYEERRKVARQGRKEHVSGPYRFITISREIGALGDIVAAELAHRLNWTVYDKEIVDYITRDGHVRKGLVDQLDERARDMIHDTAERFFGMFEGHPFGNEEYHVALVKTLVTLAAGQNAILLGHGGAYVLQDQPGLHVRITASLPVRVERLSRRWGLSPEDTRRRVQGIDAERRHFLHRHFKTDGENLRFFHMVFNTDHFAFDQIVASIMTVMEQSTPADINCPEMVVFESVGFHNSEVEPEPV